MSRKIFSQIDSATFDVIVVGAGINGAGIAHEASAQGLKTLLLDKGDIAGGTTGWSTRLIHGGLRYLEHGEISLVRESLREREELLRIAPHLVKPLPILIPIYKHGARPSWVIRAGMIAYDLLSYDKSLEDHRLLSPAETLRRVPALQSRDLLGAILYYDAQVEYPERLTLENALAARDHGATVLTYARVDRIIIKDGAVRGVKIRDLLSNETGEAYARVVINVAGPWVDEILQASSGHDSVFKRMIGGTKGSHIVIEAFEGAPADALYSEAQRDARPFFIIPWNDKYLIGTTDERYEGDLDHVMASEEEIEYLIRETNRLIPAARLTRDSVLYSYAGVRPLPFVGDQLSAGKITRRHFLHSHAKQAEGLFSIVGGKLTTYCALSQQIVKRICQELGVKTKRSALKSHDLLPGALPAREFKRFREEFKTQSGLPEDSSERLVRIYGARAREVLKIAAQDEGLRKSFSPVSHAINAEIIFSFREEMAETLLDCLLRRTMVGLNSQLGLDATENAAKVAQKYLGWSESRAERETASYRKYVERLKKL